MYDNGLPIFDAAGLRTTQYIITGNVGKFGTGHPDLVPYQAFPARAEEDGRDAVSGEQAGISPERHPDHLGIVCAPEDELHERIVTQNEAISAVSRAIRRTRSGLKDPRRPSGSFIFLGPSGVGKTELSKALAEFLFGDEDALILLPNGLGRYRDLDGIVSRSPGRIGASGERLLAAESSSTVVPWRRAIP